MKNKKRSTLCPIAERHQMEKTLQSFDELPCPPQRIECVHAFTKFAGMTFQERTEFLKNAERWSEMSPAERQVWRDLVSQRPAMAAAAISRSSCRPMPPSVTPHTHPAVATNNH